MKMINVDSFRQVTRQRMLATNLVTRLVGSFPENIRACERSNNDIRVLRTWVLFRRGVVLIATKYDFKTFDCGPR